MKKKKFHLREFMKTCGMVMISFFLFGAGYYVMAEEFILIEFFPWIIIFFVIAVIAMFTVGVLLLSRAYKISENIYR